METRTSEDWYENFQELLPHWLNGRSIYDPDGWNRKDFDYSWGEELITLKEFINRAGQSTLCGVKENRHG